MITPNILALVLAGGEGTRLHPLTQHRSKPSVPFGGRFRIVDFVLSNLVNSKIFSIYLLVQYKSQSLIEHIRRSWLLAPIFPEQFIAVVPPQMREGPEWFQGTADAVYQNLGLIEKRSPDLVVIFGADHIYRMDVRQMVNFHLHSHADVSIAALPVPIGEASAFGIIDADEDGSVRSFREKPTDPSPMAGDPTRAFASMGNYIFTTDVLIKALREGHRLGERDFGKDLLPRLIQTQRVFAYDFCGNRIPGIRASEEPAYWRDVGTIDAYFAAHQDLLGAEPKLDLFNPKWRIGSSNYQGPSPKFFHAELDNSIISAGGLIKGARIRNSIVRREVFMEEDVELDECIIMDYAVLRKGARLRRTIVDRYNTIEAGDRLGYDADADRRRFTVTDSGIVVVPRGQGMDIRAEERMFRYL
ncbi:MAG: glucose-1-phosphate adenylyltransferase [Candidatus Accumulibacter phosphatis]|uniref:Glucose-1-phosphate adenylyltransferase n=1 Tax=Candidatus Accumulibacter contiguus TaxID=2954381 RepID=A0ABX1TD16_9PROT|nr:glucose-1-phosphate adenylyltransferase [Candidatus Accumulibacter contiguus]NMQ07585.1 glucose-1-phosphate adenylyltransferase [Candidatus Accumulibacter contiguus]